MLRRSKRELVGQSSDAATILIQPPTIKIALQDKSMTEHDIHHHHLITKESTEASPHVHDEASLKQIINRLSRIEGHIRGVKTMVRDSRPCPEVLIQIAAIRGAIDRVARIILDEHLEGCLIRAAEEGNIEIEIKELKAALDRFLP